MGSIQKPIELDVLIVGGGFGAFAQWKKIKELNPNLSVKIYEKAPTGGGIWYWNCYPGARVDSDYPIYQLFDKELYTTFNWTERFPGQPELREYFKHVEKTWNVTPDIVYNKAVEGATWDQVGHSWKVVCADDSITYCKWLLLCIGAGNKVHMPALPGLDKYKGRVIHTARWPQYGVNVRGKKIAVVGTGASGVQVIQELGDEVKHLTVYQRTPNFCIPMGQRKLDKAEEDEKKRNGTYTEMFDLCRRSMSGSSDHPISKKGSDDTPEQRQEYLEYLWPKGGFTIWQGSYIDLLFNQETNDEVYKFWRAQVLKRIKNPRKRELLAPEKAPHPWGTKRPSLEQRYYEVIDQNHIDIVDLNTSPIVDFTSTGIISKEEGEVEVDLIVLATGFDAGLCIANINLVGINGETIQQHWSDGVKSSMGISVPGFPNMFYLYGTQAPSAFTNGPSLARYQAEWVAKTIEQLEREGVTSFGARREQEEKWVKELQDLWNSSLFPKAKGWYSGGNIPGKKEEGLFFLGGMPQYLDWLDESCENDHQGWIKSKRSGKEISQYHMSGTRHFL